MPDQFVSEPIVPVKASVSATSVATGTPGFPKRFFGGIETTNWTQGSMNGKSPAPGVGVTVNATCASTGFA